jgi:hypothetical protein
MVYGALEIGVRGSTCARVFIAGPGAPGGVRLPCANPLVAIKHNPRLAIPNIHADVLIDAPFI